MPEENLAGADPNLTVEEHIRRAFRRLYPGAAPNSSTKHLARMVLAELRGHGVDVTRDQVDRVLAGSVETPAVDDADQQVRLSVNIPKTMMQTILDLRGPGGTQTAVVCRAVHLLRQVMDAVRSGKQVHLVDPHRPHHVQVLELLAPESRATTVDQLTLDCLAHVARWVHEADSGAVPSGVRLSAEEALRTLGGTR